MDPITGISIASSAAQLTDFMFKLVSGTRSIYKSASGTSAENENLATVVLKLRDLTARVNENGGARHGIAVFNREIAELADACTDISNKLIGAIEMLNRGDKTVWKSLRAALKTIWKKEEVRALYNQLCQMQCALVMQLQFSISNDQSDMNQAMCRIEQRIERLGVVDDSLKRLKDDICSRLEHEGVATRDAIRALLACTRDEVEVAADTDTPSTGEDGAERMGTDDFRDVPDWVRKQISEVVEQITDRVPSLVEGMMKRLAQGSFLSNLYFPTLHARQHDIKPAHAETFEWVFEHERPPDEDDDDSSSSFSSSFSSSSSDDTAVNPFPSWLQSGSGIFWISGKAGSGKSTLMKFIVQHQRTRELLEDWAQPGQDLIMAKHFFWNSGSQLQMSQVGLLRTLLFDLLRHCPKAIPTIPVPYEYEPGLEEMLSLLKDITAGDCEDLTKKFCFFIDGLDEFNGDHTALIDMVERLASTPNVKVCVSSRPWTCFFEVWGQGADNKRFLRLEDLTRSDIAQYVRDNFDKHRQFQIHSHKPQYCDLVQDVVDRADGVFLWVFLVMRSLLNGLTFADSISDLRRRLAALPSDLEGFFLQIITSVNPFYRSSSSEVFLMAAYSPDPLPALIFSILDEMDDVSATTTRSNHTLIPPRSQEEVDLWLDQMRRRLDARTKGLLEVKQLRRTRFEKSTTLSDYLSIRTEFLHRSVRDFLETMDVNSTLRKQARPGFDPASRLARAFLVLLKSKRILPPEGDDVDLWPWNYKHSTRESLQGVLDAFLHFCWRIEQEQKQAPMKLLEAAERAVPKLKWKSSGSDKVMTFFSITVGMGLRLYVAQVLELSGPDRVRAEEKANNQSLLHPALTPRFSLYSGEYICLETVQVLLKYGASPDLGFNAKSSPWLYLLGILSKHVSPDSGEEETAGDIVSATGMDYGEIKWLVGELISRGASLTKSMYDCSWGVQENSKTLQSGPPTASDIIRLFFEKRDAEDLINMAPQTAAKGRLWDFKLFPMIGT